MQSLSLTTTTTGKKKLFVPRESGKVSLYVCGITPYDFSHIGHGRCYVTFDLLYRLLQALGYEVAYCRNFTDIDDKLLNKARVEFGDEQRYHEIATRFINAYHEDMQQLDCLTPAYEPLVTQTIPQIIAFIEGLIDKGYAYAVQGDVYFHVKKFTGYGRLSHRKLDELQAGARVAVAEEKQDPLDFALWKSESEGKFWKSPWGWGRPGWHIECSAMAYAYLGTTIDIHGGGMDLIFPHHENEVAQSESFLGQEFARYWVHNAFVRIDKEKMSKSLGNFFTLRDVFAKFDPMVLRYYFLNHHYRSPLDFSWEDLEVAQKSYQRLCKIFGILRQAQDETVGGDFKNSTLRLVLSEAERSRRMSEIPLIENILASVSPDDREIIQKMINFICDDLNTPGMFGIVFEHLPHLANNKTLAQAMYRIIRGILGLALVPLPEKQIAITPEMQVLLDEREQARKDKNWKRADELRDQLKQLGFEVQDKKI